MRQKELEKWLKIVIIAVALCGLVVCAVAIPWIGHVLIASDPQISDMYIPWLVMFIISAIPCYVVSGLESSCKYRKRQVVFHGECETYKAGIENNSV